MSGIANSTGARSGVLGTTVGGMIINAEAFQYSTRTSISNSTSTDRELIDFGDYNKQKASSTLLIYILVPSHGMNAGVASSIGVKYGSANTIWGGMYTYTAENAARLMTVYGKLNGHTTTGAQAVSFRHGSQDGTNTRPVLVMCQNSSDDGRYHQHIATAIVYEVMV